MTISNNLVKQLREIGLKQNEAEIYLWLLENGISTPPAISKGTSIARTNCYNILKSLLEKDVLDEKLKGKKKVYLARDPKTLKLNLERKIESVTQLLPDLEALHTTQKNKPLFHFYDGFNEVKEIYNMSLSADQILAIGSTKRLNNLDASFFEEYIKKCEKKNIMLNDLLTSDSRSSSKVIQAVRKNNHQIKFLPEEYSKNVTDLLIWDKNIALISLEEPIFGTLIISEPLTDTFKAIFQLIWVGLH